MTYLSAEVLSLPPRYSQSSPELSPTRESPVTAQPQAQSEAAQGRGGLICEAFRNTPSSQSVRLDSPTLCQWLLSRASALRGESKRFHPEKAPPSPRLTVLTSKLCSSKGREEEKEGRKKEGMAGAHLSL